VPAYLDHAATTPLDPAVLEAMLPHLRDTYGNPSSAHAWGRAARAAVETAREQVAAALGVTPLEVLFTSGGTESDNIAVLGLARAARAAGRGAHVVTTAIEHRAVLSACEALRDREGFDLTVVAPGPGGVVDPGDLLGAVRDDTVLVACMAANNEIGTVQPLAEVAPALRARGVALHVDAVQAFGRVPLDPSGWGVAGLALSAHKFCGPKGVGVLVLRRDAAVEPVQLGGGQERGIRSGTLDAPSIVGCGAAAALAAAAAPTEVPRLTALRDALRDGLCALDGVTLVGSAERRLPTNVTVAVAGCDGESLLAALDARGVAVSAGSACQSGAVRPSHVLTAIGADPGAGHLRLTLGRTTTAQDVATAVDAVHASVALLRGAGGGFA